MYESPKYNMRKIQDFLLVLEGLRAATRVRAILQVRTDLHVCVYVHKYVCLYAVP
jgi:hypothetical protein